MDLILVKTIPKSKMKTIKKLIQANLQIFVEFLNKTLHNSDWHKAYLIIKKCRMV
jgi:hypothetical protein